MKKQISWFAASALALMIVTTSNAAAEANPLPPELAKPSVDAVESRERGGLPNFFAKLKQGGAVRIAYLGGSITAQDGWRPKTLKWFQEQYPAAQVSQINAAIGGTGSDLGVFRLRRDVLDQKPDLLFVEFAVNDGGTAPEQIYRCMEGIVRQTWKADPRTDICFVYTLVADMAKTLQAGKFPTAASAMEKVADQYGIPSIHFGVEVARLEKEGKLILKGEKPKTDAEKAALGDKILFSPDNVHPYTDTGHALYLEAVMRGMQKFKPIGEPGDHKLVAPIMEDNYESAKMLPFSLVKMSGEWQKLDPSTNNTAKSFANRLPEMWRATHPGDRITFKFKGRALWFYDLLGPDCGQMSITIDDKASFKSTRFDPYSTYHRLGMTWAASGLPDAVHTVTVELLADPIDKVKVLAKNNEKMDNPKRFEGLNWYVGALMLIGDIVKE